MFDLMDTTKALEAGDRIKAYSNVEVRIAKEDEELYRKKQKKKAPRITEEQKATVLRMKKSGYDHNAISIVTGCTFDQIKDAVRRYGRR